MIGYHLAYENDLVGMVMTQGRQREVINIGLAVKQICTVPADMSVAAYAESQHHKVRTTFLGHMALPLLDRSKSLFITPPHSSHPLRSHLLVQTNRMTLYFEDFVLCWL